MFENGFCEEGGFAIVAESEVRIEFAESSAGKTAVAAFIESERYGVIHPLGFIDFSAC